MLFTQINTLQIQKKENIFNLIVQYLEKYSSIVQQLHTGAGSLGSYGWQRVTLEFPGERQGV